MKIRFKFSHVVLVASVSLFVAWTAKAYGDIPTVLKQFDQSNDEMPAGGKWAGQKVENKQKRSIVLLSAADKEALGIPKNQLAVANYLHEGTFYVAVLRGAEVAENGNPVSLSSGIEKVVLAQKHWAAKVRPETQSLEVHTELLFYFNRGAGFELVINQNAGVKLKTPKLSKTAVFSVEAARSVGEPNAPFFPSAIGKNFALAHRLLDINDRNKQHEGDPDRQVTLNRLDLTKVRSKVDGVSSTADALLFQAIQTVNERGRKEAYDILRNNCTNNIFTLLDKTYEYNWKPEELKGDVLQFIQEDAKTLVPFLEKMIETQMPGEWTEFKGFVQVPLAAMASLSPEELQKIDLAFPANQEGFMISVPAFTDGHLKARGLLPHSPCSPQMLAN